MKKSEYSSIYFLLSILICFLPLFAGAAEEDLFDRAPWSGSIGIGRVEFEGDEVVEDSLYYSLKLGYDFSPRWTLEGDLAIMPYLDNNTFDNLAETDKRYRLDSSTSGVRFGANMLFHLRNTENMHWDPYLSVGGAFVRYADDMGDGKTDTLLLGGGGLFYHFNDAWALRADVRTVLTQSNTEANLHAGVGVNWRWGTKVDPEISLAGGVLDSDNDGLIDDDEEEWGTDPYDPDTDDDGLLDGEEVHQYDTDPLNPDSDWDLLQDGEEVKEYETDPNIADTDEGGVSDGHEVIEDDTDPLNPDDDLILYTLNILFDTDKSNIRPEYYDELDVIVKVLDRDPEATAKIEGHADKRPESDAEYNVKLSQRRAKAVVDYLVDVGGIERDRLSSEGYGFNRPIAPNDTPANMQKNRRTEVYIRPGDQQTPESIEEQVKAEKPDAESKATTEESAESEEPEEPEADVSEPESDDEYPVK